jgi:large subunit ribosomal protein L9
MKPLALAGRLAAEGELATVRVGYFRNYLAPQGLAKLADEGVLAVVKAKKLAEEAAARKLLDEANALATALATIGKFTIKVKANNEDKRIFGSITAQDVVDAVKQQTNQELVRANVTVPEIKTLGTYAVSVRLHPAVTAQFNIVVSKLAGP